MSAVISQKKAKLRERISQELEAIRTSDDEGLLRAPDVVAYARQHPQSALYSQFEWDTEKAAEAYLLVQARQVIKTFVTVIDSDKEPVTAYVSLEKDRKAGGGYRRTEEVFDSEELTAQLIEEAKREFKRLESKYRHLEELAPVFEEVKKVRGRRKRTAK